MFEIVAIALLLLHVTFAETVEKEQLAAKGCEYCQTGCAKLELKGINTFSNFGSYYGYGSHIINDALKSDCNRSDSSLEFPGTTMKSIREIVEKGQFIGELNCDVSGRELCACESADLCYRGMAGSKVALMPYCDLNDGCKVYGLVTAGQLMLNAEAPLFSVHPLLNASDPLSLEDLPSTYLKLSSVRCRPKGISCTA